MGTDEVKKICGEEQNIFIGWTTVEKQRQDKKPLVPEPNEPTKERPLSFVLHKSPFASVSTVSRGLPSLALSGAGRKKYSVLNRTKETGVGLLIMV
jgi:hypothetical protein